MNTCGLKAFHLFYLMITKFQLPNSMKQGKMHSNTANIWPGNTDPKTNCFQESTLTFLSERSYWKCYIAKVNRQ